MKCAIAMIPLVSAASDMAKLTGPHSGETLINDPDRIDALNSVMGAPWVAGQNPNFEGMKVKHVRPILGAILAPHRNNTLPQSVYDGLKDAPAEFDARTEWKGLVHEIRDQAQCGSCWAFSASEVLSDRFAIATKTASPVLSPEDMVSCDKSDDGCSGGMLPNAWTYLKDTGIVTDACFPYGAGGGKAPACVDKCANGADFQKYKASSVYSISGNDNLQKDLSTNGPIQVAFMVYSSFMSYKSGVYTKHIWEILPEGGHAVKLMGWGNKDGTDYWLVANSWTTDWGMDGFFLIKRGVNECKIETDGPPYAGLPATASQSVVV